MEIQNFDRILEMNAEAERRKFVAMAMQGIIDNGELVDPDEVTDIMNNEDYVSYELAKRLKEFGFAEPCDSYYIKDNAPDSTAWIVSTTYREDFNADSDCPFCKPLCSAPTLAQAQKWLREVRGIDVLVWNCACGYGWEISKADTQSRGTTLMIYDDNGEDMDSGMWLTYENALSAGITTALELIEEGE